jgi:hypothetical protein
VDDNGGDGDEGEPEDSETSWACTLIMSRHGGADGSDTVVRLRIGMFRLPPTPHHSMLVALLKVPFPLLNIMSTG